MKNFVSSLFILVTILTLFAPSAKAVDAPNFPFCANYSGSVKVEYANGTHGIVGSTNTYTGSDKVYSLGDNNAMQCFCPTDGKGIQTNWWKIANLSESEIKVFESQGWIFVPNGALWGLAEGAYLAKNIDYSCNGSGNNNSSNSNNNSSSNSGSSNSGSGSAGAGSVLGVSTSPVLGLATTGSMQSIVLILSLGLGFLSAGLLTRNSIKE